MSEWRESVRAWAMSETPRPGSKSPINIAYFRAFDIVKGAVLEFTQDGRRTLATLEKHLGELKEECSQQGAFLERLGLQDGIKDAIAAALARCGKPVMRLRRKPLNATIYTKRKKAFLSDPELRGKILVLRRHGFHLEEIARKVGVSSSSVHRVVKDLEEEGWIKKK